MSVTKNIPTDWNCLSRRGKPPDFQTFQIGSNKQPDFRIRGSGSVVRKNSVRARKAMKMLSLTSLISSPHESPQSWCKLRPDRHFFGQNRFSTDLGYATPKCGSSSRCAYFTQSCSSKLAEADRSCAFLASVSIRSAGIEKLHSYCEQPQPCGCWSAIQTSHLSIWLSSLLRPT